MLHSFEPFRYLGARSAEEIEQIQSKLHHYAL